MVNRNLNLNTFFALEILIHSKHVYGQVIKTTLPIP